MKKAYVPRGIFRTINVVSEMGSIGIAIPPTGSQKTYECADTECNAEDLIGMVADCLVGDPGAVERFVSNLAIDFFATFECDREMLAGFAYFFPGYIGGRLHYGLGVLSERAHVIADRLFLFFHKFSIVKGLRDVGLIGDVPRPSLLSAAGGLLVKQH